LAEGAHTVVATETDTPQQRQALLTFTLDTTPRRERSLSNDTGASATDRADPTRPLGRSQRVVTFREGNTVIGTTIADASGHWSFTPSLADGSHTIVATGPTPPATPPTPPSALPSTHPAGGEREPEQ